MIIFEEVSIKNLNGVVRRSKSLEHQSMVEQISWENFELIIFNEEIDEIRKFIKSVLGNRFDQIAIELKRLEFWHTVKVFSLDKSQVAAGDDVFEKVREEISCIEFRQISRSTIFNPNIFNLEIGVTFLVCSVNVCNSHVGSVDNEIIYFTPIKSPEKSNKFFLTTREN